MEYIIVGDLSAIATRAENPKCKELVRFIKIGNLKITPHPEDSFVAKGNNGRSKPDTVLHQK